MNDNKKGQAGGQAQDTTDTDQDFKTKEDVTTTDDTSTDDNSMSESDEKGGEASSTSDDFEEDLDSDTYEAIDE